MKGLTLNQKEQRRLHVLNRLLEGACSMVQAAELLGVSERHPTAPSGSGASRQTRCPPSLAATLQGTATDKITGHQQKILVLIYLSYSHCPGACLSDLPTRLPDGQARLPDGQAGQAGRQAWSAHRSRVGKRPTCSSPT